MARSLLLALAVVVAAVCVRLGFWQLDRRATRESRNAEAEARMALLPADLAATGRTSVERFRRVAGQGVFDFGREVALAARPRDGAPGVHLVTPFLVPGTDTLLVVLRGWVYSPDAATVDFGRWIEPDSATVEGYALPYDEADMSPAGGAAADPSRPASGAADSTGEASRTIRRLDRLALEQRFGAPVFPYYVLMTAGGATGSGVPSRMPPPLLVAGPHLSYAVQWFLFAAIFGVGAPIVLFRRGAPGKPKSTAGVRR